MPIRNLSFSGDADDIVDYGWYRTFGGASNVGGAGTGSWLLCLPHSQPSNYQVQVVFPRGMGSDKILRREKLEGEFGGWKSITFT